MRINLEFPGRASDAILQKKLCAYHLSLSLIILYMPKPLFVNSVSWNYNSSLPKTYYRAYLGSIKGIPASVIKNIRRFSTSVQIYNYKSFYLVLLDI